MRAHPFGDGRHPLRVILTIALRVWLTLVVLVWASQELLFYPGMVLRSLDASQSAARAAEVQAALVHAPTPDGAVVELWTWRSGHDRVVVIWHGNGELAGDMVPFAAQLDRLGWDLVSAEFPGYGDVDGWPRESTLTRDAHVAWTWVTTTGGYDPTRVVLMGRSMGGGVAAALAADVSPAGLVLESTYDSLVRIAQDRLPIAPVAWLTRSRFDTLDRVDRLTMPVFQTHSQADRVIPFANAVRLRDALPQVTWVEAGAYAHGRALVLEDPGVSSRWYAWLEETVPTSVEEHAPQR